MDTRPACAVIGAGNSGYGLAADLGFRGYPTRLFDLPSFSAALEPVAASRGLRLRGARGEGFAPVEAATSDAAAALEGAAFVFIVVPGYGQEAMAHAIAPHLAEGQAVVLFPGNMGGALECARVFRRGARARVLLGEGSSFIFACKKDGPDGVWIRGVKQGLPVAALPASDTPALLERLQPVFPECAPARDVLDTSLNNINHMVHPPAALLNVARSEVHGGDWSFFLEGMSPAVCRVMERIDEERLALVAALGLPRVSLLEWTLRFYAHQGMRGATLHEAFSTTPVHAAARAPASVEHRYFTEDVPYGLVPIASLAESLGIPVPMTRALIDLAGAACGRNFWAEGRTIDRLGLRAMTARDIAAYVEGGT